MVTKPHAGVRAVGNIVHYVRADNTPVLAKITALGAGDLVTLEVAHHKREPSALSLFEALYQAHKYSGSGDWLDEANGHDAAPVSDPVFTPGVLGDAFFTLDGSNRFTIPNAAGLQFGATDPFTVIGLATTPSFAIGMTLLSNRTGLGSSNDGYRLSETGSAGTPNIEIADGTVETVATSATGSVAVDTLFSAACVRSITSDNLQMYVDGVASGTAATDATTASLDSSAATTIGNLTVGSNAWVGRVYAIGISRSELTAAQLLSVSTELMTGKTPRTVETFTDIDLLAAAGDTDVWYKSSRRHP